VLRVGNKARRVRISGKVVVKGGGLQTLRRMCSELGEMIIGNKAYAGILSRVIDHDWKAIGVCSRRSQAVPVFVSLRV